MHKTDLYARFICVNGDWSSWYRVAVKATRHGVTRLVLKSETGQTRFVNDVSGITFEYERRPTPQPLNQTPAVVSGR